MPWILGKTYEYLDAGAPTLMQTNGLVDWIALTIFMNIPNSMLIQIFSVHASHRISRGPLIAIILLWDYLDTNIQSTPCIGETP
jgi:hypothetical protein